MAKQLEERYITTLINLQMTLESLHPLKSTKLYQHKNVKMIKRLDTELEQMLKKEGFEEMYIENEEAFTEYIRHVEYISKWIVKSSFKDVLELGAALHRGEIRFEEK
jgi:ribosomal protein S4